jgi:heme-degrading monooxygenase HmoA
MNQDLPRNDENTKKNLLGGGPMIARMWSGVARLDSIDAYVAHLRDTTFPAIEALEGHRGAYVLRRASAGQVLVTVITLWESIDAIARFSGDDVEAAVVPPEAQALLASWDTRAVHWEVVDIGASFAHK